MHVHTLSPVFDNFEKYFEAVAHKDPFTEK